MYFLSSVCFTMAQRTVTMTNWRFETKIQAGFAAVSFLLVAVLLVSHWNSSQFKAASARTAHSNRLISELDGALTAMVDAETGMRGYVLTGAEESLEPFVMARREISNHLAVVRTLARDEPRMQKLLAELEELARGQFSHREEVIRVRRDAGFPAALEMVQTGKGKQGMDQVRRVLAEMKAEQRTLLEGSEAESRAQDRKAQANQIALAALIAGLLLAGFFLIRRHLEERRKVEQIANAARVYAESIEDTVREPLLVLDRALRIRSASRAYYSVFHAAPAETEGAALGEISGGRWNTPGVRRLLEAAAEGRKNGENYVMEQEFPGVGRKKLLLNAAKLYRPGNHTELVLLAIDDVTERDRLEREQKRFFALSHDLFCVAGFDGFFKMLNDSWEKTTGHSCAELLAKPYLEWIHPEDRASTAEEAARLSRGESTLYFENRFLCKDGAYKWLLWSATPVASERLTYGVARDVTAHKQTEQQMIRLRDEAENRAREAEIANRELEAFSYSVSHDLRAPLRHVIGFSTLLEDHLGKALDAKGQRLVKTVKDSASRMGVLIDDLLLFSRMGRMEMRRASVDLNALAAKVIRDLWTEADSKTRHVEWSIGKLPVVQGDGAMLEQVFVNLISNALKYTRPRDPARIEIFATDGEQHVISVRDNGVGFDDRYKHKLFGVFQRLHDSSQFEGTGIGLANVRRIVNRHGGNAWAESQPGEGAAFSFSIPKTETNMA